MTFNEKILFIENYQFDPAILERVKKEYNYSDFKLNILIDILKDYFLIHLIKQHQNSSVFVTMASFHVDQLWHWFILFTPQYRSFCDIAFGKYLDHIPTSGVVPTKTHKDDSYFNTLHFLKLIKSFRNYSSSDLNKLNSIPEFYSIFAADYIINDFSYEDSILKSLYDLS